MAARVFDASPGDMSKELAQTFAKLDPNGLGFIEKSDLARLLRILDPNGWHGDKVDTLLYGAGMQKEQRVEYAKFIAWLVQAPFARISGNVCALKHGSALEKAAFLDGEWNPFLAEATGLLQATRRRHAEGFALHEVMPSHAELAGLAQRCMALTQRWHGRGNVSAFYDIFMDMAELDGHSPYFFRDIPQKRSADCYSRVLDGQARRRLYSAKPANSGSAATSAEPVGRLPQTAGESAIDNLELPNIMHRRSVLLLMAGDRIQRFLVRTLRWKQRRILMALGLSDSTDEAAVRRKVEELVKAQGIEQSLAHEALSSMGRLLESFGQVPPEGRRRVDEFLAEELGKSEALMQPDDIGEELQDFLTHCQKHPGRAYKASGVQHKLMVFRAMASPSLRVLWRSDVERFTQHKYFCTPWTRVVPLLFLPATPEKTPGEHVEADFVTLRKSGATEFTRHRKNVFAYGEQHGVCQSGGGWAEAPDWPVGTLMYELGALLCVDEAAKVPNHWITDIEKVVKDCMILCPEGGMADALPGEALHDAGQNPVIASSIGPTQHTQAMRASARDFPLMGEQSSQKWFDSIGGSLDLVQIGESEDAFFISARSRRPDAVPFLQMLVDFRLKYMKEFGRTIDFNATCHPTEDGEFIVNLAPVACIRRVQVPKGEGCMGLDFDFENPDIGQRLARDKWRLAIASVDASHGKGNILAASDELWDIALDGRPMLARLYDFNRKPGSRAVARSFFQTISG